MMKLQVYIAAGCWTCEETGQIVADIVDKFADLTVEMIDTNDSVLPDDVFAVPTYLLNGRVISLGNPTRTELVNILMHEQHTIRL